MKPPFKEVIAAVILMLSLVTSFAGPLEDADTAYRKGDYATALRLLRPLADQGHPIAQSLLGISRARVSLAPAAYNAGPGRVSAWLTSHRPLPAESRNYVAIVTGWTTDEWASELPPQTADTTNPQGVPCTRLANLILAPKEEAKRIATYIPRWGIWLAAHLVESKAWAMYRERLKRFASLIGDREPMVLQRQLPGMGSAMRYIITIADDDRRPLDKLCQKLTAADIACDVMRSVFGPG